MKILYRVLTLRASFAERLFTSPLVDISIGCVPRSIFIGLLLRSQLMFEIRALRESKKFFIHTLPSQSCMGSYRILKRRIGWVLGKSAPEEELSPGIEPAAKIWELLSILLQDRSESSDIAVRLSAALAIRERTDVRDPFPEHLSTMLTPFSINRKFSVCPSMLRP
jgi:hypothetical protein